MFDDFDEFLKVGFCVVYFLLGLLVEIFIELMVWVEGFGYDLVVC